MSLISDTYRNLNEQLHKVNPKYGTSGQKYIKLVMDMSQSIGTQDILDYGCGKSTLANNLPFTIKQYDPAIFKYNTKPNPADIVVCTDVLEHIEPECLDDVLKNIFSLVKKAAFLVISTVPAQKILADGRNAHLIQENEEWWKPKIEEHIKPEDYNIINISQNPAEIIYLIKKSKNAEAEAQGSHTDDNKEGETLLLTKELEI